MLKTTANFLDKILRRYTPDPYIFALLITFLLFATAFVATPLSAEDLVLAWGGGFWKLTNFTLQMVMVLVGGYVVASSTIVDRFLHRLAKSLRGTTDAVLLTTFVALVGSWLNWGFGLVVGALLCRKIGTVLPKVNFRLLVASSYSGFLVWHAGLSASIPLLIATSGSFSEGLMGGIIPIEQTIFSSYTLIMVAATSITVLVVNVIMARREPIGNHSFRDVGETVTEKEAKKEDYPVEKLERSKIITLLMFLIGLGYIVFGYMKGKFQFDLNGMNFIFLFLGMVLHKNPRNFLNAVGTAAKKVGPLLLQFPFYGAIMGLMTDSGLATTISEWFVSVSTPLTFNLFTFWSAGFINMFIPSGGGHWIVQGPIIIPAAKAMGVDTVKAAMAIAWGDSWTNMLQPFWALPVLAIAGLHLRDIMGYCVIVLLATGVVLSTLFCIL